jgi:hypothetical protein
VSARSETSTLQEVLAAEHAVVFGYGVAGARLAGADRRRALAGWSAHGDRRDRLAGLIAARGATPVPPAASYVLPSPVRSTGDAVALLAQLEDRLADVWADAVARLSGDLRGLAATGLADTAVAGARWRGTSLAFPGLPERAP